MPITLSLDAFRVIHYRVFGTLLDESKGTSLVIRVDYIVHERGNPAPLPDIHDFDTAFFAYDLEAGDVCGIMVPGRLLTPGERT
jgi:hypothetical protein